ncbi:MAG: AsmA-like C-terminal domain-containing protein [Candidatus Omnitrophota bacterium]
MFNRSGRPQGAPLLKILIVLALLSALAAVIWYQANRERLIGEIRIFLENSLSKELGQPVTIGAIGYAPLSSLSLKDIAVHSQDQASVSIRVRSLAVAPEILPLLLDRKFIAGVTFRGLEAENLSANARFKTVSRKAGSWKQMLDLALLETVAIDNGSLTWMGSRFKNIRGSLELDDLKITRWKTSLSYNGRKLLLDFKRTGETGDNYHGTVDSDDFSIKGTLSPSGDLFLLDSFKGNISALKADLKGKVTGLSSENKTFELSGNLSGRFEDLLPLVPKNERSGNIPVITGPFAAVINTSFSERDIANIALEAEITSENAMLGKAEARDLAGKISIKNKKIDIPGMSFTLLKSPLTVKLSLDTNVETLPLSFNIKTGGMDIAPALSGMPGLEEDACGPLTLDLSFKGSGRVLAGLAEKAVKNPGNTPLSSMNIFRRSLILLTDEKQVQDFEINAAVRLEYLRLPKTTLNDISAEFFLNGGKLNVPSLKFRTFGGAFFGYIDMDLAAEKFPLAFQVQLQKMDSVLVLGDLLGPDNSTRGGLDLDLSFSGYGLDLASLAESAWQKTGTEPGSPTDTLRNFLALLVSEKYVRTVTLDASAALKGLELPNARLENITGDLSLEKGRLGVHSFGFEAWGGKTSGDLTMDLTDRLFPFTFHAVSRGIDLAAAQKGLTRTESTVSGALDMDLSYEGYARDIADIIGHMKKADDAGTMKPAERFRTVLDLLTSEKDIRAHILQAALSSGAVTLGKISFTDVHGKVSLSEGRFEVSSLTGSFYKGLFTSDLAVDLENAKFPFAMNTAVSGADFGSLIQSVSKNKTRVYGTLDGNLHVRGEAINQSSYTGFGKIGISNADLGPMPILSPLLGNIYSAMQNIIPAFKKIEITSASAALKIEDRKLLVEDLEMLGGEIDILGSGYVDFDGNLNISFENRLTAPDYASEENWQISIRNFITTFGKTVSKAYLRGTVKDPKWEMEYLTQIKGLLGRNIKSFFQNLGR